MGAVVVVGAAGLLGRELVRVLASEYQVYAVQRLETDHPDGVIVIPTDLSLGLNQGGLPARADHVVFLAQSPRFRDFPEGVEDVVAVNIARLTDALTYARGAGARSFVYASTGGVYGTGDAPFTERAPVPPPAAQLNFYAASKLCGELLASAFSEVLAIVRLRYFFIYGPAQKPHMLVPRLIESVRSEQPIGLQGCNGLSLNPVYVGDAALATAAALGREESCAINVAGPQVLTLRELADAIGARFGRQPIYRVDLNASPGSLIGDIGRMADDLVAPTVHFADALKSWP